MKFFRITLITVLFAACFSTGLSARQISEDSRGLESEINIMENVIETVLTDGYVEKYYNLKSVKGTNLEKYGLIFQISYTSKSFQGEKAVTAKGRFDKLIGKLRQVYPDYISRIRQLNPKDKITMVVYPTDKSLRSVTGKRVKGSPYYDEEFKPYPFVLTAERSEILSSSPEKAVKLYRINEEGDYVSSNTREDMRILKAILERAIEDEFNTDISRNSIHASYIKSHGLLVSIKADGRHFSSYPRITLIADAKLISETKIDGSRDVSIALDEPGRLFDKLEKIQMEEEKRTSVEERTQAMINSISGLIGNYGVAMSGLSGDDRITVSFSASGHRGDDVEGIDIQISIKYNDIVSYNSGRIDLKTLRERADIRKSDQ